MACVLPVIADLLVHWMAETGHGAIRMLRARVAWAARTCDIIVDAAETGRWLRDLSSRGYAELDWEQDLWTVAPLVVTRLPGPDALAVVVGMRSAAAEASLASLGIEVHRIAQPGGDSRLARPATVLLQYDQPEDLRNV